MAADTASYQFIYTWKIRNFSMCSLKRGDYMYSPSLIAESLDKTKWRFRLYPKGIEYREFPCFLFRASEDDGPEVIVISGSIGIVDANGVFRKSEDPFRTRSILKGENEGANKLISLSKLFEDSDLYLPDDTLTIQCQLKTIKQKKSIITKCIARTDIVVDKSLFQWNIRKFDSYHSNKKLCVHVPSTTKLEVEFFLTGSTVEDGFATFVLRKKEGKPTFIKCFVTLINKEDFSGNTKSIEGMFTNETNLVSLPLISKKKLFQDRYSFEKEGAITLQVEVVVADGTSEAYIKELIHVPYTRPIGRQISRSDLNQDLRSLYLEKKFSDVQLKVGKEIFPSHKSVLSARSPVFEAMFEQDMTESKTGVVDLVDIDSSTLDNLLLYLYTDTLKDMDYDETIKLYSAADKYLVSKLKEECASLLKRKLSQENVFEMLSFADLHGLDDLKEQAKACINRNPTKLLHSDAWKELVKLNPLLAGEVMILVTDNIMRSRKFL